MGGKGRTSRRPALVFLAQAALSFVGMVVIPTRLAYEVLVVQPPAARASAGPAAAAAAVSVDLSRTAGAAVAGGGGGAEGRRERRRLSDSGLWVDGGSEGGRFRAAGSKGRALQTADDEESFTYSTRTQFHLCAESEITEEALRAGVMNVFGVEEAQVGGRVLSGS